MSSYLQINNNISKLLSLFKVLYHWRLNSQSILRINITYAFLFEKMLESPLIDRVMIFVKNLNHPYSVWMTGKTDQEIQKDSLFAELYNECCLTIPGRRLSYSIRNKMDQIDKREKKDIVSRIKEGCSPLFIACMKGNVEIVEYLIKDCGANVEQKGVYEVQEDRTNHYVTPLWCAAVSGQLDVVKCLVKYGANVNVSSDSGSTPVRSACFMTYIDIVSFLIEKGADILKPNQNGGTPLINSVHSKALCQLLIDHGADVNVKDIHDKTALHYAISGLHYDTTVLFLHNGADIHAKSLYGDDALQTACLKMASQIFDYLISFYDYPKERIADALELMGSMYLDEQHDLSTALKYWRRAIQVRYSDPSRPIRKKFIGYKKTYLNAVEFQTMEDLEAIEFDLGALRIQSLLISERILGPLHRNMIFKLMFRGASYADNFQYQRCIDLWIYAFELRIQKHTLLHNESSFALQALIKLCLDFYEKQKNELLKAKLRFDDMLSIFKCLNFHLPSSIQALAIRPVFKNQQDNFDVILKVLTHIIYLLNSIDKTPQHTQEMKNLISKTLKINPRDSNGDTLLHLVVSRQNTFRGYTSTATDTAPSVFPNSDVIELLLECGASVDAMSYNGNCPIHIASTKQNFNLKVIKALLKYGDHIDRRSLLGNVPYKLISSLSECTINPLNHITLQCLAARAIVENQIFYKNEIPQSLENFIRIH